MATIDKTQGVGVGFPASKGVNILRYHFDASVDPITAADVHKLLNLPAGAAVLAVSVDITKADAGGGTIDVGDSGLATRYISAQAVSAAAFVASVTPHFYAANDTLNISAITDNMTTLVADIVVVMVDTNAHGNAMGSSV